MAGRASYPGADALGATAAGSLFGPSFRLTQTRGVALDRPPSTGSFAGDETSVSAAFATIHPSAVPRALPAERDAAYDGLVADLRIAAASLTRIADPNRRRHG